MHGKEDDKGKNPIIGSNDENATHAEDADGFRETWDGVYQWGNNVELGRYGEDCAATFVQRCGLDVVERNWKCPAGEVDIIARSECAIHFIEVKTRRGTGKGFPEEAVDAEKRRRYERIAEYYLRDNATGDMAVNFDVIGIIAHPNGRAFLKLHNNAFCRG